MCICPFNVLPDGSVAPLWSWRTEDPRLTGTMGSSWPSGGWSPHLFGSWWKLPPPPWPSPWPTASGSERCAPTSQWPVGKSHRKGGSEEGCCTGPLTDMLVIWQRPTCSDSSSLMLVRPNMVALTVDRILSWVLMVGIRSHTCQRFKKVALHI